MTIANQAWYVPMSPWALPDVEHEHGGADRRSGGFGLRHDGGNIEAWWIPAICPCGNGHSPMYAHQDRSVIPVAPAVALVPMVSVGSTAQVASLLPLAASLRIHRWMPASLTIQLVKLATSAHELDLYVERWDGADYEADMAEAMVPSLSTLRRLRVLHNPPLQVVPLAQVGLAVSAALPLFDQILPRLVRLTHLVTSACSLSPSALCSLPPSLVHVHVEVFRPDSPFCGDPAKLVRVLEDRSVDFGVLATLTICDEDDLAWQRWDAIAVGAARARGIALRRVG